MPDFIFRFFNFFEMAGTIRKVTSNTLTYSQDFSSLLSDDRSERSSLYSSDIDDPAEIEFDLRDGTISLIGNDEGLADAPPLASEAVIPLESPPLLPTESHASTVPPLIDTHPVVETLGPPPVALPTSRMPKPGVRGPRTVKPATVVIRGINPARRRNLSQLVEELVGSPISTKGISKAKGDDSPIFPITRNGRRNSPAYKPPSPKTTEIEHESTFKPFQPAVAVSEEKKRTPTLRPISVEWKCPDSWIPNHRCDAFCIETLRSF